MDALTSALCANNQTTRATRDALVPQFELGDAHADLAALMPEHERVQAHQVHRTISAS